MSRVAFLQFAPHDLVLSCFDSLCTDCCYGNDARICKARKTAWASEPTVCRAWHGICTACILCLLGWHAYMLAYASANAVKLLKCPHAHLNTDAYGHWTRLASIHI